MPQNSSKNLVKTAQDVIQFTLKNPLNGQQELAQAILEEDKSLSIDDLLSSRFMMLSMNAFQFAAVTTSLDYILWLIDKVQTHYKELLKIAKLKMEIKNARTDFFYGLIGLGITNWHVASILYARAEKLGYDFFRQIDAKLHFLERTDKTIFLNQIMLAKGTTYEGYFRQTPVTRPRREYAHARESQLLKQLSTLIYFHLPDAANCIEVECMHLRMHERSYLFVAANPALAGSYFSTLASTNLEFEQLLKKNIGIKGDREGGIRVKRYALKMRQHIFGLNDYIAEESSDFTHFQELAALLRADKVADFQYKSALPEGRDLKSYDKPCYFLIREALFYFEPGKPIISHILSQDYLKMIKTYFNLDGTKYRLTSLQHKMMRQIVTLPALNNTMAQTLNYNAKRLSVESQQALLAIAAQQDKQIIFLSTPNDGFSERRHAEEFLIDVLDVFKQQQLPTHAAIAGKKRPCMTCSGRMLAFNLESAGTISLHYGQYPGFLWLSALKTQNLAAMHASLELFVSKPSHVTGTRDKLDLTDYASDTDEELDASSVNIIKS